MGKLHRCGDEHLFEHYRAGQLGKLRLELFHRGLKGKILKIHPVVIQQNGIVSVTMQALFVGGANDATGQQRIEAYGDPVVQLGGQFTDPGNPSFSFPSPAAELYAGLTTQLASHTARFMTALPSATLPGWPPPAQGQLDSITANPVQAATVWAANTWSVGQHHTLGIAATTGDGA